MKFQLKTVDEEYARNSNIKKEDIRQLQEWVKKQSHLPPITEFSIIQYYQCCDYSQQKTKDLLDLHYSFRNEAPELFGAPGYEPPKYQYDMWEIAYILDLPKPSPEGYRLVYCGLRDTTPSKYNFEVGLKTLIEIMLTVIHEGGHCDGYSFVFDIQGIVFGHLASVSISLTRKFLYFVQEAIPAKVAAVHLINISPILDKIMILAKPFLKKDLYEKIHIHSDMNEFYKIVPKDCLPCDLGGTLPSRKELQVVTRAKVDSLSEQIEQELRLRSDEKKRIDNSSQKNNISTGRSMEGSFKKLIID